MPPLASTASVKGKKSQKYFVTLSRSAVASGIEYVPDPFTPRFRVFGDVSNSRQSGRVYQTPLHERSCVAK